jgi:transcription elongation factor Elf1
MVSSSCERCGGSLVSITFVVGGEPRTMRSCSACDLRTWLAGSDPIDLDGVLADLHGTRRVAQPTRR